VSKRNENVSTEMRTAASLMIAKSGNKPSTAVPIRERMDKDTGTRMQQVTKTQVTGIPIVKNPQTHSAEEKLHGPDMNSCMRAKTWFDDSSHTRF
jgi:hypothetical protein